MSHLKIPYYDKRFNNYDKTIFFNCNIQKILALFLSDPSNYNYVYNLSQSERQEYFLMKFETFREKYISLNLTKESDFDMYMYFTPLNIDKKGSTDIAGGDSRSRSGRKSMLDEYHQNQNFKKKIIEYFNHKYEFEFSNINPDPRLFLGHKEIWLNPSPDLLSKEGYEWVVEKSYNDETFVKPIDENIDPILVPIKIRNKVCQKIKYEQDKKVEIHLKKLKLKSAIEDEEDEIKHLKNLEFKKLGNFDLNSNGLPSPTSIVDFNSNIDGIDDW